MMGSTHLCEPRFGRFDGGGRRVHHGVQLGLGQELAVRRRVGVADGIEGPRQLVQAVLVEEHGEVDGVVVAHRVEALPAFAGRGRVCADGHVRAYCRGEGGEARGGDEVSVVCAYVWRGCERVGGRMQRGCNCAGMWLGCGKGESEGAQGAREQRRGR